MPQPKNTMLRVLVPVGLIAVGIGVAAAVFVNSRPRPPAQSTPVVPANAAQQGQVPTGAPATTGQAASTAQPAGTGQPAPSAATPGAPAGATSTLGVLHAQVFPETDRIGGFDSIGSIDDKSPFEAMVEFSTLGVGVRRITLAHHFDTIRRDAHTVVQHQYEYTPPATAEDATPATQVITPMAADSVLIDGQLVSLLGYTDDPGKGRLGAPVWRQTAPGAFEAIVQDGQDRPVARVERIYSLAPGSFNVVLTQRVHNLTAAPFNVQWVQFGPADLDQDSMSYGGDKRRVRFGYLYPPASQRSDPTVLSDDFVWPRSRALGAMAKGAVTFDTVAPLWPNDVSTRKGYRLVWAGLTNRYFGAAIHPLVDTGAGPDAKVFNTASTIDRVLLHRWIVPPGGRDLRYDPAMVQHTTSDVRTVAPSAAADLSMGLYAGPLSRPTIEAEAAPAAVGLSGLVVYNFGGACYWCTFGFLTSLLLGVLRFLAHYLVFDWGLAIVLLVIIVRSILHPVTRWSQIRMARFGKQMQAMAPKQKKLQEKFASDPQRLREETARLWREEGISPTGMLGCIPGFLQSPVWIALSAMLYFAFDLRHQPAFFGLFQKAQPHHWPTWWFLGDLAEPDRFLYFGRTLVNLPVLGEISSINILPMLLGVVFFIQQKYLTPPPTSQLTPEQEQQQKIMKIMMVVMFPLMMYSAPSGLALYFIANSTLAILESRYIRSHIDKYDLLNAPRRSGPKEGGFMARLQKMAEQRQQQVLKARGMPPPRKRV
jgi:YidC/Oxa1 family membrane protein insertase